MSIMKLWDENTEEWKSIPTLKGDPGPKGDQGIPGDGLIEGGVTGQVLKKKSDIDHDTEWGDAADPNAITSSDESVKDVITVTKEEFDTLVLNGELVEATNYQITGDTIQATTSTPVGGTMVWPGLPNKLPANYMLCEGQSLNKIDYPTLYDRLGNTYGSTDTTFNLPNIKGRIVVHLNNADTEFDTLGKTGGSKYMQAHIHSIRAIKDNAGTNSQGNGIKASDSTGNNSGFTPYSDAAIKESGTGDSENLQPYITGYYIIKVREEAYTEDLYNLDKEVSDLEEIVSSLVSDIENRETILYNGGTNATTLSLSDNVSNYDELEIVYGYEDMRKTVKIPVGTSANLFLSRSDYFDGSYYGVRQNTTVLRFSGTTATKPVGYTFTFKVNNTIVFNDSMNDIVIFKITGIKKER